MTQNRQQQKARFGVFPKLLTVLVIVSVLIGKTTGLPGLALAVPIRGEDETVKGVLVSSMATVVVSALVTNVSIGETGYAFLLDARGRVIAHQSMRDSNFRKDFS